MRQWTVDAFAAEAFRGNPACVVEPFADWPSDEWMQALAAENNQAETAYLRTTADPARYDLRWFTPTMEVDLCGHATLAAAHVLATELGQLADSLTFDTHSGPLIVRRSEGGYEMDFPADPPRPIDEPFGLTEALGVKPVEVWAGRYLVALMADAATVRGLRPDIAAIHRIGHEATGGPGNLVVAAPTDQGDGVDIVDRFFAPGSGVPEDPATGSAHCILGPLFADKLGRPTVRFLQAYPGRGGDIETETRGDRLILRGQAVTFIESVLRVSAT